VLLLLKVYEKCQLGAAGGNVTRADLLLGFSHVEALLLSLQPLLVV
jgi:hypothetical protein